MTKILVARVARIISANSQFSPRFAPALRARDIVRHCPPSARGARVAMALSKLSDDEQGIILGQLRNTLEPRLVMYFSSANKELRALLTPAVQQILAPSPRK